MRNRIKSDGVSLTIHEDDRLRLVMSGNPDDANLILCFTGVGGGVGGVQVEEFVGSTRLPGYRAIYVTDKLRSWYNDVAETILATLQPYVADSEDVVSIGNSMGGFGAIWIAGALGRVRTAMAFAPQFSMHPDIVPEERRWSDYRSRIETWRIPSLADSFVPQTNFWTFNGGRDEEHWRQFPVGDNSHHLLFDDAGHDAARVLKQHGVLSDVISDCIAGIDPKARIAAAGVSVEAIDEITQHRRRTDHRS